MKTELTLPSQCHKGITSSGSNTPIGVFKQFNEWWDRSMDFITKFR